MACETSWGKLPGLRRGNRGNKNVQLVLHHCCKPSWKAMLHVLPPTFKPFSPQIKVTASWVNTDFWLDKLKYARTTPRTGLRSLAAKQVCFGPVKRATCTEFVAKKCRTCNKMICCRTGWMWVVKRAAWLFNSFCSNVANKVARCLMHVLPYL